MNARILAICMGILAAICGAGCTSFEFQLSQTEGLHLKMTGAPPTLYKLISYEGKEKAFDAFHFQAEGAEDEPEFFADEEEAEEEADAEDVQ